MTLTKILRSRYVVPGVLTESLCDEGPCPPPSLAEITARTLDDLPKAILPHLTLVNRTVEVAKGKSARLPTQFRGPIRIASSGDAKTDEAIAQALKLLGPNSGVPVDAHSFPSTRAAANVLIYSLGPWEDFPRGVAIEDQPKMKVWRDHRSWLLSEVAPRLNPLYAFVASKVGSNFARIYVPLINSRAESDMFVGVDDNGVVSRVRAIPAAMQAISTGACASWRLGRPGGILIAFRITPT